MRPYGLTVRLMALVLGAAALVGVISFLVGFTDNRAQLEHVASTRAATAARALVHHVSGRARAVERAVDTMGAVVLHVRPDPDQTRAVLRSLLAADPGLFGVAIVYAPGAFTAGSDFATYLYRADGKLHHVDIAQQAGLRDTTWYRVPALTGEALWSEPHRDVALADHAMVSYTTPVFEVGEGARRLLAVVKVDLRLGGASGWLDPRAAVPDADLGMVILSREGRVVGAENIDEVFRTMPREVTGIHGMPLPMQAAARGREDIRGLAERMMRGERATQVLVTPGHATRQWAHFMPVATTGWSVAVIVDEALLLAPLRQAEVREFVRLGITLLALGLIVALFARRAVGPLR